MRYSFPISLIPVFVGLVLAVPAQSQVVTILNNYGPTSADPIFPAGVLAQGADGNLYSTTSAGGADGAGAAYRMSPTGTLRQLYSFPSGSLPQSGLTLGTDGVFYGTNASGASDFGSVFSLTSSGTLTILQTFTNPIYGAGPYAPPVAGRDHNLYGTTTGDGFGGSAYTTTPGGNFRKLYEFGGADRAVEPYAALTLGDDGNFYGTTVLGGLYECGTFFQLTASGNATFLHDFYSADGCAPASPLLQTGSGAFFGTTSSTSVIFRVTASGAYKVIHNFNVNTDGQFPTSLVLASDGNLYGVTSEGGANSAGTIFRLTPGGTFSVIYNFAAGTSNANSLMQHTSGLLYGTTGGGGVNGFGTFFSVSAGLRPFAAFVLNQGPTGSRADILGQGLTSATLVTFNGVPASFTVVSDTFLSAVVPSGATTGPVIIETGSGTLTSNRRFVITR